MPTAVSKPEPVLFYRRKTQWDAASAAVLLPIEQQSPGYRVHMWAPSLAELRPRGSKDKVYFAYSALNALALFPNPHYGAIVIRDPEHAISHTSMVVPPNPRFPFMSRDDLQIGATWTSVGSRGRGLATRALLEAARQYADGQRSLWYLCETTNVASQKVAEKAGFTCIGKGRKVPRFGLAVFGFYSLASPAKRTI
jgi:GNAT superfamily N-acetyltransferase